MPEDLVNFGLIPEFIGRLPVVSAVHQLRRDDLVRILTEPKNALVKQYQRFFGYDTIELVFTDDALWEIGDKALERETGARGLRSIIEGALLDVMFELPSRRDVSKCVITRETIAKGSTRRSSRTACPTRRTSGPSPTARAEPTLVVSERTRTYTWSEPVAFAASGEASGLAYLQAMVEGRVPQPPIGATLGFLLVEVGRGTPSSRARRPSSCSTRSASCTEASR